MSTQYSERAPADASLFFVLHWALVGILEKDPQGIITYYSALRSLGPQLTSAEKLYLRTSVMALLRPYITREASTDADIIVQAHAHHILNYLG